MKYGPKSKAEVDVKMIEPIYITAWLIIGGGILGRILMKNPPKVMKGILSFIGLFGLGTGAFLFLYDNFILITSFYIWCVGIVFILILLILAGI